jgi:aldehyde:ferredoxin oxidoreductase
VSALSRDLSRRSLGSATAKYRELGTVANLAAFDRMAVLPTRNFQRARFEQAGALAAESLQPVREVARASCASCSIGCEHLYALADGRRTRIEYESLFALGPLCGIGDPEAVLAAARRCDELGLDSVSAGGTLAFAMECGERGYLTDVYGSAAPRFGDAAGLLALLDDIAHRRGLGDLLAEGSRIAAGRIGHDSLDFAPQVKGLELPGYEPRALQTLALGFAVGTRGADHNKSGAYELDFSERVDRLRGDTRSAALSLETEDRAALTDSLILCKFLRGVFRDFYPECAELLSAVTGWEVTGEELRGVARRVVAARKAFNVREGWQPADDTLPRRFLSEPLADGASSGARLSPERLREMIRGYNLARGWTEQGHLPEAVMSDLSLELA